MFSFLLWLSCSTSKTSPTDDSSMDDSAMEDSATSQQPEEEVVDETPQPCPEYMEEIDAQFCIDRFEASLEEYVYDQWQSRSPFLTVDGDEVRAVSAPNMIPQAYISGEEASIACQNAGKRLCSSEEWIRACQGASGRTYPYGFSYQEGYCNDRYEDGHPLIHYFGTSEGIWDSSHMNDPGINQQPNTVAASGFYENCKSEEGVYDLHGNLHEWVDDPSGIFRGGFYADAEINGVGCNYRTTAHHMTYHDYSTGFRCCAERMP